MLLESIITCYQAHFQRQFKLDQLPTLSPLQISSIFDYVEHMVTVSQGLLVKLEAQNNYYPLIFGIGRVFQQFAEEFQDNYSFYLDDLQRKLDLLEELKELSPELVDFLNLVRS